MGPFLSSFKRVKELVIGKPRNLGDKKIFQHLSLIAFFAWVGLGADGLSSSCYGPEEAFLALGSHTYLSLFVAIGTVLTILVISAGYSQIVELFPSGGGGYFVASKLLSPTVGMISGCALLIDYVLTISISIASGADALFSLLPAHYQFLKFSLALGAIVFMILLNLRGVKESILVLTPIFLLFIITHVFIIFYAMGTHLPRFPEIIASTSADTQKTLSEVGFFGLAFLILRAYSMGAGTFTGIEAVSNGIPVLREPQAQTAKRTMIYMAASLSFVVLGLMLAYLFYHVAPQPGKTLNATLFGKVTASWGTSGYFFVLFTLISEAAILFVAAQAGFVDGPRVLGNMALDRWFPSRFSVLSDRLVMQNGILIMGTLALLLMIVTRGSVRLLVVLYSINVFITFVLSQLGMVRHWWRVRSSVKRWLPKLLVNGVGLLATAFILVFMVVFKFFEGGWITLLITGALVTLAIMIKRHYRGVAKLLQRLNPLVEAVEKSPDEVFPDKPAVPGKEPVCDFRAKTAVLLVHGFNGIGLHTLFGVLRKFSGHYKNFVFVEVGVLDSGNFKGPQEMDRLETKVKADLDRYVSFMKKHGYYAEGVSVVSVDVVDEVARLAPEILKRYPNATFFGGQLVFDVDSFVTRLLHNYVVFTLQRRLYQENILFVILPIRV